VYGARKVWAELRREGIEVARCTTERLMRELGIAGAAARRKKPRATVPGAGEQRPADLLERDFSAAARPWATRHGHQTLCRDVPPRSPRASWRSSISTTPPPRPGSPSITTPGHLYHHRRRTRPGRDWLPVPRLAPGPPPRPPLACTAVYGRRPGPDDALPRPRTPEPRTNSTRHLAIQPGARASEPPSDSPEQRATSAFLLPASRCWSRGPRI
jgi:helix-turn-helix protein